VGRLRRRTVSDRMAFRLASARDVWLPQLWELMFMATTLQAERPLTVKTPLGKDDLLLVGFSGSESISELFNFQLDLLAENDVDVPFEKLLGQKITVTLDSPKGKKRHFHGICSTL